MNEMDKITVSDELKKETIDGAKKALRKKRISIISIFSIVAILIISTAILNNINMSPEIDLINTTPEPTEASEFAETNGLTTQEYEEALKYAKLRHVNVYTLTKIEKAPQYYHELTSNGVLSKKLEFEKGTLLDELYKYGYYSENLEEQQDKDYYLVIISTPFTPVRFVSADMQPNGNSFNFRYTSLDLGPFTVKEYGSSGVSLSTESAEALLVSLPPSMAENGFTAEFAYWEDLDEQDRIQAVMDTIYMYEDYEVLTSNGVENELQFEINILCDHLEGAIEYLKSNQYFKNNALATNNTNIARYVLYILLNRYQIKSFDTTDSQQTIKKEILQRAIEDYNTPANCVIIPEIYVFGETIPSKDNINIISIYGYSGTYSFVPPLAASKDYYAFCATLEKNSVGEYKMVEFVQSRTQEEIKKNMWLFADDAIHIDSTLIKSSMTSNAYERYCELTGEPLSIDLNDEEITINFKEIENYLTSRYIEINSTYPAIARDMQWYVLDKEKNDDILQIAQVYPLSEDFDNPITVAVLTATYDGTTNQSEYAKLYAVTAEYDKQTWELINIESEVKETLSGKEYSKLLEISFYSIYETLYKELIYEIKDINSRFSIELPIPLHASEDLIGDYIDLKINKGVAKFINVHRLIRGEEDSGTNIPIWYSEENPKNLSNTAFIEAIKNTEFIEIEEDDQERPYSYSALGFLGYTLNIDILNNEGLFQFKYMMDTIKSKISLTIVQPDGKVKYYISEDSNLCQSGIETFNISTDVTEYMVTDEKGPTLPEYREELRFLTAIVGDMPGGIIAVNTSVSDEMKQQGYEDSSIDNEDDLIYWAMSLEKEINDNTLEEITQIPLIDNPDVVWDVELAPQEGAGSLYIIEFKDTKTVYIRLTYRIYGNPEPFEKYYVCENNGVYEALLNLSYDN